MLAGDAPVIKSSNEPHHRTQRVVEVRKVLLARLGRPKIGVAVVV
jgi:hypothetical protein